MIEKVQRSRLYERKYMFVFVLKKEHNKCEDQYSSMVIRTFPAPRNESIRRPV